jgi:hypothetical protein
MASGGVITADTAETSTGVELGVGLALHGLNAIRYHFVRSNVTL